MIDSNTGARLEVRLLVRHAHAGDRFALARPQEAHQRADGGDEFWAVLESITGLGRPGISSNPSTSLKSNSFSMILEPLIFAS